MINIEKWILIPIIIVFLTSCTNYEKKISANSVNTQNYLPISVEIGSRAYPYFIRGNQYQLQVTKFVSKPYFPYATDFRKTSYYFVRPTNEDWIKFRSSLDTMNIWKWKSRYVGTNRHGMGTTINIAYKDKNINVNGVKGGIPKNITSLWKAIDLLIARKKQITE